MKSRLRFGCKKGRIAGLRRKNIISGEEGFQNPTVDPQKSDKWHFNFALQWNVNNHLSFKGVF